MSSPTSSSQLEELRTDLICSGLYLLEVSLGGCVVGNACCATVYENRD